MSSCTSLHVQDLDHDGHEKRRASPLNNHHQAQAAIDTITRNMVGANCAFKSPFGTRYVSYGDFTASGKSLACIEQYIQKEVLPLYGNTHTTSSITGLQSTSFREEAREIIAKAVNAHTDEGKDVVLFTGQGSTAAINKLITALGLNRQRKRRMKMHRPIVFVGPFEHHANLLPWRESCADVVQIPEDKDGRVDTKVLIEQLRKYAKRPLKIGSFAAASNLTGLLTDVDKVSAILHQHGALAFWDYATCAPYVEIDMNPATRDESIRPYAYKDAVFMSGHKFIGGPGTPGVLVCKRRLIDNAVPTTPAGGTVFFVTKNGHRYLDDLHEREEGGTPDVVGAIRLGLAFQMKMRVGTKTIMEIERKHAKHIRAELESHENIVVLGKAGLDNLPIFSFLIRFGKRFLHFNFVCALMNDLFGIQARGGCQCAGPYAARILGVNDASIHDYEHHLVRKSEIILKPGFSRISFPYFMPDEEVEYILEAIKFIASNGWKFLPLYRFDKDTGAWFHHSRSSCKAFSSRKWLANFDPMAPSSPESEADTASSHGSSDNDEVDPAEDNEDNTPSEVSEGHRVSDLAKLQSHREQNLINAAILAEQMHSYDLCTNEREENDRKGMIDPRSECLRWFAYPKESYDLLRWNKEPEVERDVLGPIQPQRYCVKGGGCEPTGLFSMRSQRSERSMYREDVMTPSAVLESSFSRSYDSRMSNTMEPVYEDHYQRESMVKEMMFRMSNMLKRPSFSSRQSMATRPSLMA